MKSKLNHSIILFLMIIFIFTVKILGQETNDKKSFGLSVSIQEAQYDIMLPICVSNSFVVAPAIGLASVSEGGTDIGLGIVTRFYLNNKTVRPFLGGRVGILVYNPSSDGYYELSSTHDYIIGILAGGEYFMNEGFSIGVEAQLNASVSDENSSRFGNPGGVNINTGSAVFATVYF